MFSQLFCRVLCLQAREAELERTVQDLNAALVASRGSDRSNSITGDNTIADASNGSRVKALEADLETANSHLALERERVRNSKMVVLQCFGWFAVSLDFRFLEFAPVE